MISDASMIRSLGNEAPILADGRKAPDRREISFRWLCGTFLTGITSSLLMGVALFAALDGRQQLAIPAEAYAAMDPAASTLASAKRGNRILAPSIIAKPSDRTIMEVSTMIKDGEKEVVRRQPFAHVKMTLAANHQPDEQYPNFDPLAIFSSEDTAEAPQTSRTGTIYGTDVESEVALKTVDFPLKGSGLKFGPSMSLDEVEENVRTNGSVLTDGNTQLASLFYIDPRRFASDASDIDLMQGLSARVVEENMTVSPYENITNSSAEYADDVIPVRRETKIAAVLVAAGYAKAQADDIAEELTGALNAEVLREGDVLRIGIIQKGEEEEAKVVRASVYTRGAHVLTIALDDKGNFVRGNEPAPLAAVASAFDDNGAPFVQAGSDLPRVYDGVYRAALSYGMNETMIAKIIKLLASNVDFQAQLKPTDKLEAIFSVADESGKATEDSELLYVNASFGDTQTKFYRFQDPDDNTIDYYDQDGKSIRQFLLRNPVPNGTFRSGFGMRRHPILGFSRMHTGVDWAAPRGTPIIAAGNGVVEKAGWDSGGYGNQTLIRHANGYVSSYNHQNAIAKSVKVGAKVVQGQVIGWIGTTGMSTGPHLHYELIVNGNRVDPLRIRLPGGKSLDGPALAKFEEERSRVDELLAKDNGNSAEVAASQ